MSESDGDGSLLHEHWNSDLRLFSYDENGAYNLLQVCLHSPPFCFRGLVDFGRLFRFSRNTQLSKH